MQDVCFVGINVTADELSDILNPVDSDVMASREFIHVADARAGGLIGFYVGDRLVAACRIAAVERLRREKRPTKEDLRFGTRVCWAPKRVRKVLNPSKPQTTGFQAERMPRHLTEAQRELDMKLAMEALVD